MFCQECDHMICNGENKPWPILSILAKTLSTKRKKVNLKSKYPLYPQVNAVDFCNLTESCRKSPESRQATLTWVEGGYTEYFS